MTEEIPPDLYALVTATLAGDAEAMVAVLAEAEEATLVAVGALLAVGSALSTVCRVAGVDVADVWRLQMIAREAGR